MYSPETLQEQALIDDDQWGRLESELGLEMLREFADEFFEETREIWFVEDFSPQSFDPSAFKSMAHRSAGAAGTIGFKKLRFAFLCLEHNPTGADTAFFLKAMQQVFQSTLQWVHNRTQG